MKFSNTFCFLVCVLFFVSKGVEAIDIRQLPSPYSELERLYPFDPFGWFDQGKESVVGQLISQNPVRVVVEIGSFLGKSTRFIAQKLPQGGRVYAVDHWKGNREHQNPRRTDVYPRLDHLYERFLSNVIHANLCDKIFPIKASSLEAVKIIQEQPDLVFVDGSHEYEDVLSDLAAWYSRLGPGGVLCGDDWSWGGKNLPVQRAVIDFAYKERVEYFAKGAIWWMYKKS